MENLTHSSTLDNVSLQKPGPDFGIIDDLVIGRRNSNILWVSTVLFLWSQNSQMFIGD
jgi:hypothetical protein